MNGILHINITKKPTCSTPVDFRGLVDSLHRRFRRIFCTAVHARLVDFVEDMIKKLVFTTSGFDVVNKAVKRRLLSWLTDQFQNYVDYVAAPAQPINSQRSEGS